MLHAAKVRLRGPQCSWSTPPSATAPHGEQRAEPASVEPRGAVSTGTRPSAFALLRRDKSTDARKRAAQDERLGGRPSLVLPTAPSTQEAHMTRKHHEDATSFLAANHEQAA